MFCSKCEWKVTFKNCRKKFFKSQVGGKKKPTDLRELYWKTHEFNLVYILFVLCQKNFFIQNMIGSFIFWMAQRSGN